MKKNFTKLVCVGIACFCIVSAMGQEKMTGVRIAGEKALVKDEVNLRAGEKQQPDSVVMYYDDGYKANVFYYVTDGPGHYYSDYYKMWCTSSSHFYVMLWMDEPDDVKYNSSGLVESMTFLNFHNYNYSLRTQYQYNANGYLLSVEYYSRSTSSTIWESDGKDTYLYDAYGNWVGLQYSNGDIGYSARVDSKGRIVYSESVGTTCTSSGCYKLTYYIWYYSDGRTPNATVENNNPIGNNNLGGFDLDVNIPADSISNGSITVTFPEGFTLDAANSKLTIDFTGKFELKITKQENNSWLFEINPKTLRSASLRAGEAKRMLHVAYKVDEKKKRGTYDIMVNSILFETKGGNYIPEPAITVSAAVNRWGVGNELVNALSPTVYISNQTIYIQAESAEQIVIYSITGNKLYETTIQAGLNTINANHFPQGILFVKGSSGWVNKLIVK